MKKWIIGFILSGIGLTAFVYMVHAEPLTPRQIEDKVIFLYGGLEPALNCVDMAKAAKVLAEENGYRAVYRSSFMRKEWNQGCRKHRWLVIYTPDGQAHEILKTYDVRRDIKREILGY
jgi:hypothetical protein